MVRDFQPRRYFVAGLLTFLIFTLGILLGLVIEGERLQYIQKASEIQKLDFESLQLQYAYINQLSEERDCDGLNNAFDESVKSLENSRSRVETYNEQTTFNREDFEVLRREYTISQLRYYLLAQNIKDLCQRDIVSLIYFFASDKECPDCDKQAVVLTYLKRRFGDKLLNFVLDADFEAEPMVNIVKKTHSVTNYPTLIIEGEKYEGFLSTEEVLEKICKHISQPIEDCSQYQSQNNDEE